jgi:SAM-dependent methyltransferase
VTIEEGKQANWKDGVGAIGRLFWYRFVDRRFTHRGGHDTLESLGSAGALNNWILSHFKPYLGNQVLEAGCGTGNMTKLLLDRDLLVAVDIDSHYCEKLRRRYGHLSNLQVEQVDLEDASAVRALGVQAFDTVVSINVLEHVADDAKAMSLLAEGLQPGGHLLVLVPAQPDLYSAADVAMGHHRRYEPVGLRSLLEGAGLDVVSIRDFNRLGVLGWRFNKVTGRSDIAPWQARVYGAIVPLARRLDELGMGRGLSLVAIATRPGSSTRTTARAVK